MSASFASVAPLLNPRSIAVVGASSDLNRVGGRPIRYLQACGFQGAVYPVNPSRSEIAGLPCYAHIGAVPAPVDMAILALPADRTVQALRDCAAAGVRSCVIFTAGFAELGPTGAAMQAEMAAIARESGMRLCGPNCAGLIATHIGAAATFGSHLTDPTLLPGHIGFVSQSGAVGAYLFTLARARGVGFSHWVTTGNEADTQVADYVGYLAGDPNTRVIGLYLEQVRDGQRLLAAVRAAHAAGKPVVAIKVGKTDAGQKAAMSHTASMVGDSATYAAAFAEMGVHEVDSLEEFLNLTAVMASCPPPAGRRVGIITVSGGVGIMMLEAGVQAGLQVPELPAAVQAQMKAALPYAATANPVDVTGNISNTPEVFAQYLDLLLQQADIDVVISFLGHMTLAPSGQRFTHEMIEISRRHGKPVWLVAQDDAEGFIGNLTRSGGVPLFMDPIQCVQALSALVEAGAWARQPEQPAVLARREAQAGRPERLAPPGRALLSEVEARAYLRSAGVPAPREQVVSSAEAATAAARAIGGRVVLKVVSADLPHKTEAGAVALGVTVDGAAAAYTRIFENARRYKPSARIDGVLVQEQVSGEAELIIGARNDATFGPVVMVGAGGILVELLDDKAIALAPLDQAAAARLLQSTRVAKLLAGVRGRPPLDSAAVADLLVRVSRLAWERRGEIASLELNPVLVRRQGEGALAVDALVELVPADDKEKG